MSGENPNFEIMLGEFTKREWMAWHQRDVSFEEHFAAALRRAVAFGLLEAAGIADDHLDAELAARRIREAVDRLEGKP